MSKRDLDFEKRINKIIDKWNRKIKDKDRLTEEKKELIRKEIYPIYREWHLSDGLYKHFVPIVEWDEKNSKIYWFKHNALFPLGLEE